ncbi:MAG: hypothetical protein KatS3mg102_2934 [Planctomycetota bacterium]|nr:MAG: hypothetical protein KatS3mg102_2934 [Planctomycetota bacterium]
MYLPSADPDSVVAAIRRRAPRSDDIVLLLLGQQGHPDLDELVSALNALGVAFLGGVFPLVFAGEQLASEGAVLQVLPALGRAIPFWDLHRRGAQVADIEPQLARASERCATALLLVDGQADNLGRFLSALADRLGNAVHYFGAGAGYYEGLVQAPAGSGQPAPARAPGFVRRPCLFCPEGVFQDAALLALLPGAIRLGVRHGWRRRAAGPIVATRTERNRIAELNWRNALEVYREIVEPLAGRSFSASTLYEVGQAFPFGLYKEDVEDLVRVPIAATEHGELVCGGEVLEHSVLDVRSTDADALIAAARQAARAALAEPARPAPGPAATAPLRCVLVADCISRYRLLRERFTEELDAVRQLLGKHAPGAQLAGALTLGEIASTGEGFLEYFNQTIVVGALHG